ncbi:MAG: glycosyltransferase family 2 protein [Candidatus Methylomirabilales bacterium]
MDLKPGSPITRPAVALSVVIPVYNEEEALPALFRELERVRAGALRDAGPVEIVLVDDGSTDRSWARIAGQCDRDPGVVGVKLSRRFGHQVALAAGLEAARGEAVVSMDADLQDPPDVIPQLLAAHRQGYDVVHATRAARGKEPWGKRVTARLFYWVIEKISPVAIPRNTGDFRLLSRRALTELAKLRESHRLLRGLVPWIGFPQTHITYDRGDRVAGRTHYPWHTMLRLACDGIASMSVVPLRMAYILSLPLFGVFVGYVVYVSLRHLLLGSDLVPGWTSLMAAITIFGTIQLLLLGVMGEYLGRIYEQVKQRPLYILEEVRRGRPEDDATRVAVGADERTGGAGGPGESGAP